MWTSLYTPDQVTPIKSNLTEELLQYSEGVKVYGIEKPMPSHIITLQANTEVGFHHFLLKNGYEIVQKFAHSTIYLFSWNEDMYYYVYRKKDLEMFY